MLRTLTCLISALFTVILLIQSCGDNAVDSNDTIAPARIANLMVYTNTDTSAILGWSAPGDDGTVGIAAEYDLRYSKSEITDQNWSSATPVEDMDEPREAGWPEWCKINNLDSVQNYYFAIKTADEVPNWSSLSNVAFGGDTIPPSPVADLEVIRVATDTIVLNWTATGDDSSLFTAVAYDLRYDTSQNIAANWESAVRVSNEPAPKLSGQNERLTLTGFEGGVRYYFALTVCDDAGNWSDLSNEAVSLPDTVPPASVTDLRVVTYDTTTVLLAWTAPGDDSLTGMAVSYDLRYYEDSITELNWNDAHTAADITTPLAAGSDEQFLVSGLSPGTEYYFALKATDWAGNQSGLSNMVYAATDDTSQVVWTKIIGTAAVEEAVAVVATDDGGCVVAGNTNASGDWDIHLAKFGSTGELIWEQTINGTGHQIATDMVTTPDGGFAIAGYTFESWDTYDALLVKTDGNGAVQWQNTYGGSSNDVANALTCTSDGGYMLAGGSRSYSDYGAMYLVKVDASGNEEAYDAHYLGSVCDWDGGCSAGSVVQTADGNVVVGWSGSHVDFLSIDNTTGETSCGMPEGSMMLSKADYSGDLLWSYHVDNSFPYYYTPLFNSLIGNSAGGFTGVMGGTLILQTNSTASVQWKLGLSQLVGDTLAEVCQLGSGDYVVTGAVLTSPAQCYLLKVSQSGSVLKELSFGTAGNDRGNGIALSVDGSMYVAGWTDSVNGSHDIYVARISKYF